MHSQIIVHGAAFCLAFILAYQGRSADRVSFEIQRVPWQLLPPSIKSVCVGPDGRIWYTINPGEEKPSDAEIRGALEKEYREASPQIANASLRFSNLAAEPGSTSDPMNCGATMARRGPNARPRLD